jgi:hypothetical protein
LFIEEADKSRPNRPAAEKTATTNLPTLVSAGATTFVLARLDVTAAKDGF